MNSAKIIKSLFWIFAITPISGVSFLASEYFFLSYSELFLLALVCVLSLFVTTFKRTESITLCLLIFFILINIVHVGNSLSTFELLKELKPYIFIIVTLLCMATTREYNFRDIDLNRILAVIIVADLLIYLFLIIFPDFMPEGIRKQIYLRTGIYRYADFATIFAQTVVIIAFSNYRLIPRKVMVTFFLFLVLVIITQDRVFLAVGFLAFITSFRSRFSLANLSFSAVFILVSLFFFTQVDSNELIMRYRNLTSISLISNEFILRAILPLIEGGYVFDEITFLFGEGLDFKFFIPWFEYRDLNPFHNSVDSFYITFFIKHGLVGLSLFLFALIYPMRLQPKLVWIWILIYFFTHNGAYQANYLLMLLFINFLVRVKDV